MKRRGQITLFLIVGIIILFVFAAIFYVTSKTSTTTLNLELEQTFTGHSIKDQILIFGQACLKEVAIPGIYLLGIQGGVIYPEDPKTILLTENAVLNYGYLNGINQLSLNTMQEQLNLYIEDTINICLNDFKIFEEQGIIFTEKIAPQAKTKISDDRVQITLNSKGEFRKGEDIVVIDNYQVTIPLRVGATVKKAQKLIDVYRKYPLHLQTKLSSNPQYFISIHPIDSTTYIYGISDSGSSIDNAPFTFMFAIKDTLANSPPHLDYIPDFVIKKDSTFTYLLSASDADAEQLVFFSDNSQFSISEEGKLEFTPTTSGQLTATIIVKDPQGRHDEQTITFTVEQ